MIASAVSTSTLAAVAGAALGLLLLVVGGYFAARYKIADLAKEQAKTANEVAADWRQHYEAERGRSQTLETRLAEERAATQDALRNVDELSRRTDQTAVLHALVEQQKSSREFHEAAAAEVRDRLAATSAEVRDRLTTTAAEVRERLDRAEARLLARLGEIAAVDE